jgi:hypothetical protein
MKKLLSLLLALVLVFGLIACGNTNAPETEPATEPAVETNEDTQAEVVGVPFTVMVTDVDGTETTFEYTSDAATVGEALLAEGLIAGEDSAYGLYITSVNGITADWDTENAYWAFYINGEYAQTGVDATEIVEGAIYSLTKTVSYTIKGEGATSFYLTVKNVDNTVTKFQINTDAATVGEALLALELIAGEDSAYGLYINTVNGITADWDTEKAYWAFYIDGEYAMTGVDTTEIVAGTTYELVKTVSENN